MPREPDPAGTGLEDAVKCTFISGHLNYFDGFAQRIECT